MPIFPPHHAGGSWLAAHALAAAQADKRRAEKSRAMIAETRRLLADPLWRSMTSPCPTFGARPKPR